MAFSINDPAIQAQINADYLAGIVPKWNPNNDIEAQAFVDYWNGLLDGVNAIELVPITTYTFKFNEITSG